MIAIIAVLATLLLSSLSGARKRSRQTVCGGNLRQIALGVNLYADEAGRRPRSLSRLTLRPSWLPNPKSLLCPQDPESARGRMPMSEPQGWGNLANALQEPMYYSPSPADLEEANWEQEKLATLETMPFSYLHPLGWRKPAYLRLTTGSGAQAGTAVCQLHGVRISDPKRLMAVGNLPHLAWEGLTQRAQHDGAVISRRIFHTTGSGITESPQPGSGASLIPVIPNQYPWELYSDRWPELIQSKYNGGI